MCKFKIGDKVRVVKAINGHEFNIGEIVTIRNITHIDLECENNNDFWFLIDDEVELYERKSDNSIEYKKSNRYKLQKAIKETGFHAEKLSLASGFKKGYFSDYTSESRFNSRGDITEDRLNSLLTTLAFAERELLGIGAKTVCGDKTYKPSQVEITISDVEIKGALVEKSIDESVAEAKAALNTFSNNTQKTIELQKKDSKARNFLIVFLIFIVILSIYFLTR